MSPLQTPAGQLNVSHFDPQSPRVLPPIAGYVSAVFEPRPQALAIAGVGLTGELLTDAAALGAAVLGGGAVYAATRPVRTVRV